ncbi:MAG: SpoIIE family protein phosphatase [Candidatus Sabulitectum sp.]|nr:SpoIIE family protein phosphatase [Candidatus Sabulitectum sp.]
MSHSFELLVWTDSNVLPAGESSVVFSEAGKLHVPRWADRLKLVGESETSQPDAALLLIGTTPTALARSRFFSLFRKGIPVGALVGGEPLFSDPIFLKLEEWQRRWTFRDQEHLVSIIHNSVQDWISGINKGMTSYPSGDDLIHSWNDVAGESIDSKSLIAASEILRNRGFVCLSGPLGAGKTTLARLLLMEATDEGLVPIELIDSDIDSKLVEMKLRGQEDCALLFDIDSIRRMIVIHPLHLFLSAFTIILKSTDSRRRVVLTSSDPRISGLFSLFGDAHVELPSPETNRQWRVEQGQRALETFRSLDLFAKAELVLLSLFEPIVPEVIFKSSLLEIWSRLHFLLREKFPSSQTLDEMYAETRAQKGILPFRRLRINGEMHLCSGDTLILDAVDKGMAELSGAGSPLVRVVMETLLNGRNTEQRRAGYNIAHMYRHLSSSEKSRLLFTASRESQIEGLNDFFAMLLADKGSFDRAAEGLCRHILESGLVETRRALARSQGVPWLRKDHYFRDLVETTSSDPEGSVRAALLLSIDMWGISGDPGDFVKKLLEDTDPEVSSVVLFYLGRKFPALSSREMEIVNSALDRGENSQLMNLVSGLMNRQLGEFEEESCDLIWLLMQRLPDGGRALVASSIGARIRFFGSTIRDTLFSDISENDIRTVAQCMLMNYKDLTAAEKATLWKLISENMPQSSEMATMVLPYIRILDDSEQTELIRIVLASERYGAREALAQLLAGGRSDVAGIAVDVLKLLLKKGSVEERSRLSWFILWNRLSVSACADELLTQLSVDADPSVRKTVASSIQRLGMMTPWNIALLNELAIDDERSVRAAAGEALAEFARPGEIAEQIHVLAGDSDPTVRTAILRGVSNSPFLKAEDRAEFYLRALDDHDTSVRLQTIAAIENLTNLGSISGLVEKITILLSDRSENVRNAAARLVTSHPSITTSQELREKLPDLYLGRLTSGDSLAEELSTARRIQMGLLPAEAPRYENYSIAVFYNPAKEVGGDYYDFFSLPDGNLGLAVADVAGKGIPAALTMAGMKGTLGASVRSLFDISQIMKRVNSELTVEGEVTGLVGLFYSVLNTQDGVLTYCNAGHNPPLLVSRTGEVRFLEEGGILMGVLKNADYNHGTVQIHPGDVLVLYTDGITETMNANDVEFDISGLTDAVIEYRDLNAEQIVTRVLKAMNTHGQGSAQADDRTLVVVKHR